MRSPSVASRERPPSNIQILEAAEISRKSIDPCTAQINIDFTPAVGDRTWVSCGLWLISWVLYGKHVSTLLGVYQLV